MAPNKSPPFDEIAECKKRIINSKRRKSKVRAGQHNLTPSSAKDWQKICFSPRVSFRISFTMVLTYFYGWYLMHLMSLLPRVSDCSTFVCIYLYQFIVTWIKYSFLALLIKITQVLLSAITLFNDLRRNRSNFLPSTKCECVRRSN